MKWFVYDVDIKANTQKGHILLPLGIMKHLNATCAGCSYSDYTQHRIAEE